VADFDMAARADDIAGRTNASLYNVAVHQSTGQSYTLTDSANWSIGFD
jgi:hypothetical protein